MCAGHILSAWPRVAMETPCPLVVYHCPRPMCGRDHLRHARVHAHVNTEVLQAFLCDIMHTQTPCVRVGIDAYGAEWGVLGCAHADMAPPVPGQAGFIEMLFLIEQRMFE